ncbi:MAG: group II intron reverse transcriptase/maturase [Leptospirales bacterium]
MPWKVYEKQVRKLQFRIAKAFREGRTGKVNTLQRLLTRSLAAKALAVRRVTENQGKDTPGVDKIIWTTPEDKSRALLSLGRRGYRPLPLRRVFIPKKNGKLRGLGIPTMKDRAMQALFLMALIPVAEEKADPNSYGFRPCRSTADAIEQCFIQLSRSFSPSWVLEGDITGCFDNIGHDWLMTHVPTDRGILRKWLKAGYLHRQTLFPTPAGTPQGGIISPTLANMALDGLEEVLKERFHRRHQIHMIRYADDFVVTGRSKDVLENEVRPVIVQFLRERGLELSQEKTRITHIQEGFDFLGQNIRKFGRKLLIRPARKNIQSFLDKVRDILKKAKATAQTDVIETLNPIIRGWANYHRHIVAKEVFGWVDRQIWRTLWAWIRRRHSVRGARWCKDRYFQQRGSRKWVFTPPIGQGPELVLASDTPIRRHVKIRMEAHPFNPVWTKYLERRKSPSRIEKEFLFSLGLLFRRPQRSFL